MTGLESSALEAPEDVRRIVHELEEAGHATWAVGGAVRDAILGRRGGDWDLATHARPEQVRRLFRRTVPLGIEHGTVGVLGRDGTLYEVTTFRRDVETFGRHAVVAFAETLEEDLARRDFTFNAVAWHPLSRAVADPFGGARDLEAGILKTVGEPAERFAEDYLRVLRGLRFAGHYRLEVEAETWRALTAATPHLTRLSAERVREELWKVFRTPRASGALSLYAGAGVLAVLYPELEPTIGLMTDPDAERDVWTRSLLALDHIPPSRPTLRLAALLHGIGMPAARTRDLRGGWRFTGHEQVGARKADELLIRLKFSNAERARVVRLVANQTALFPPDAPAAGIRRWLRYVGVDLVRDLFRLRFALWCGDEHAARGRPEDLFERWRSVREVLRRKPALEVTDLEIGGADLVALGHRPGPTFGEILRELLDLVLEDPEMNQRERLLRVVEDRWPS